MRYRRKRYFKRSTNLIKMKFQSFMDISTNANSMQVITISAGGREILRRLASQFGAYKYYKIGNISVKLVPASTLPVDPTGLSITAGDNLVDPRDQLTPGLMRITNGEDVFEDITGLTDDQQHGIYNNMLLDPRWYKWMLQTGVKRHATPRYWQIGQLHQDKWPGALLNIPVISGSTGVASGTATLAQYRVSGTADYQVTKNSLSDSHGFFQVGHRGVLGWLPTDGLVRVPQTGTSPSFKDQPMLASPPEVEVMKIILPKAYKTRYWYRAFITETVYFRDPIINFGITADDGNSYRPLDIFHIGNDLPYMPYDGTIPPTDSQQDGWTGGNFGDN